MKEIKTQRKLRKGVVAVLSVAILAIMFILGKGVIAIFGPSAPLEVSEVSEFTPEAYEKLIAKVQFTNDNSLNKVIENEIVQVLEKNDDIFLNKAKTIEVKADLNTVHNFISYKVIDEEGNLNNLYGTFVIDLNNYEAIDISTLYVDDLKGLSMVVRDYLNNDKALQFNKNTYLETLPVNSSFLNIGFNTDGLTLFYDKDTLETDTYTEVLIPYADVINYFNDDLSLRIDETFERTEVSDVRYIDPNKPMVAITFDDGPNRATSVDIAEYFESQNQRLTFFWLGSRIEVSKDVVKEVADLGHEIANHSYDHPNFNSLNDDELQRQTKDVNNMIKAITNQSDVLIRAPFGASNEAVRSKVESPLIMWSVDTLDWSSRNTESTLQEMNASTYDGSIILLHDLYDTSIAAAKQFLDANRDQYQFVTVTELHEYSGKVLNAGEITNGVKR